MLSRPSSGVTYKEEVLDWALDLQWTRCLQFLFKIHSGAFARSHLQSMNLCSFRYCLIAVVRHANIDHGLLKRLKIFPSE
jgi:hypothetical protein